MLTNSNRKLQVQRNISLSHFAMELLHIDIPFHEAQEPLETLN